MSICVTFISFFFYKKGKKKKNKKKAEKKKIHGWSQKYPIP